MASLYIVFLTPSRHLFETTVSRVILKFAQTMHCVTSSVLCAVSQYMNTAHRLCLFTMISVSLDPHLTTCKGSSCINILFTCTSWACMLFKFISSLETTGQITVARETFNPLMPNSVLQILLCLTPDNFTCQRETPRALKD